jgi:hypothetical protein
MDMKEKAVIIAALIGGLCTCTATVVASYSPVAGKLLDRFLGAATPLTPIVVSLATPIPTPVVQSSATPIPTPVVASPATRIPTPVAAATGIPQVTFILVDNYADEDFFIDSKFTTAIDGGEYLVFQIPPGNHQLSDCPRGKNPQDQPQECTTKLVSVEQDPFNWEIGGEITPTADASFILINNSHNDLDFFVDDQLTRSVDSGKYVVLPITRGTHKLQSCPRNLNPADNPDQCGVPEEKDIETASFLWPMVD